MRSVDAVIIGSGHNGLTAAAYLARAGWRVEVLEANAIAGGTLATEELTLPGYRHDTWASWHPLLLGSRTWAELGPELTGRGVSFAFGEPPAASVLADGEVVIAQRDVDDTAEGLPAVDRVRYAAELRRFARYGAPIGAVLAGEVGYGGGAVSLLSGLGVRDAIRVSHRLTASARAWLAANFRSRAVPALAIPWILHAGLTPDSRGGALQLPLMLASKHRQGSPIVTGGSRLLAVAFERLIADHGGVVRTNAPVDTIVVRDGAARGVRTATEEIVAERAVIANTSPTELYLRLLPADVTPRRGAAQARRYRNGPGCMMIHAALREPLRWRDARLDTTALVHLTDGVDGVAGACAEVGHGLLPARPTIAVGQHAVIDPTRAPPGGGTLWIQLLATPYAPRGDAAGEIAVTDGGWTSEVKDAYCQRVMARLAGHVLNIDAVTHVRALAPPDLERANRNCIGGDPYAGATTGRQSVLLRPLSGCARHQTRVGGLWHIGASTFPGPGLNADSGRMVARRLLAQFGGA